MLLWFTLHYRRHIRFCRACFCINAGDNLVTLNQFTITYYLRSLVVEILDLQVPREIARIVGGASVPVALLALTAIVAVTLTLSSILASSREYVVKDQV